MQQQRPKYKHNTRNKQTKKKHPDKQRNCTKIISEGPSKGAPHKYTSIRASNMVSWTNEEIDRWVGTSPQRWSVRRWNLSRECGKVEPEVLANCRGGFGLKSEGSRAPASMAKAGMVERNGRSVPWQFLLRDRERGGWRKASSVDEGSGGSVLRASRAVNRRCEKKLNCRRLGWFLLGVGLLRFGLRTSLGGFRGSKLTTLACTHAKIYY